MKCFRRFLSALLSFYFCFQSVPSPAASSHPQAQAAIEALRKQDFKTAIPLLILLVKENPRDEIPYHLLAVSFRSQKEYMKAVSVIEEAEKNGIKSKVLYQDLAEVFFMMGLYQSTIEALGKMEKLA